MCVYVYSLYSHSLTTSSLNVCAHLCMLKCSKRMYVCTYVRTNVCMSVDRMNIHTYIHTSEVTSGLAASCMATRLQLSGIADKPLNTESCMNVCVCMYVYWYEISIRMMYVCMYVCMNVWSV